jgi:very-short-patch-repair endonuclease
MTGRKQLSLRDATARTNSPPLQGRGRGWGISASRLATLKERAREMRRNPTEPEKRLWARLKSSQLGGFKFRRQEVVGSAIVDFACPTRWLCVEVDGETHVNPEVDALRDRKLTDIGIRVLRFTNQQVMQELDGVCEAILVELQKPFDRRQAARQAALPHPSPSPEGEGRDGLEAQKLLGISREGAVG